MRRNSVLVTEGVHHVFSRSIAGFRIFNNDSEYLRMRAITHYYQLKKPPCKFSRFIHHTEAVEKGFQGRFAALASTDRHVRVIAYCLMPTHVHFILKQTGEKGISTFMSTILNSYSRYFNTKHGRRGPLFEGRFKNVPVESNEHLLHLTRYIHLNPVTASFCNKPEDWAYSSYREYAAEQPGDFPIAGWGGLLEIKPATYRQFVEERIDYQKELHQIKHLLLE
ncbi:MAG: transposase [Endomicrobiales bacterium]